jgi:hypothetical protein
MAVALLSFASVQSIVMQAVGDRSMPMAMDPDCPMMGGPKTASHSPADKGTQAPCAFCAVAGQAPLTPTVAVLRAPVGVVWSLRPIRTSLGPRGPPAVRPKARGPPSPPLTV